MIVNIFSDKPVLLEILGEARQRREEERKRRETYFYRTQVYLGSDLWVLVSVTEGLL